jgi:hypothetical protein
MEKHSGEGEEKANGSYREGLQIFVISRRRGHVIYLKYIKKFKI